MTRIENSVDGLGGEERRENTSSSPGILKYYTRKCFDIWLIFYYILIDFSSHAEYQNKVIRLNLLHNLQMQYSYEINHNCQFPSRNRSRINSNSVKLTPSLAYHVYDSQS